MKNRNEKKELIKGLSLVFLSHWNFIENFQRAKSIFEQFENVNFYYVYDGKLSIEEKDFYENDPTKMNTLITEKNIGKFNTILWASKFIDTTHFKIVDHDDCVDTKMFEKADKKIKGTKHAEDTFFFHTSAILDKNSKYWGTNTVNSDDIRKIIKKHSYVINWAFYSGPEMICNTNILRLVKNEKFSQDYYNDNLLTAICQVYTSKTKEIKSKLYLHNLEFGQTSSFNMKKVKSINNFFKNFLEITGSIDKKINLSNLKSNINKIEGSYIWHLRKCKTEVDFDLEEEIKKIKIMTAKMREFI